MADDEKRGLRLDGWDKIASQLQRIGAQIQEWAQPLGDAMKRPEVQEGFRQVGRMRRGMAEDQPEAIRRAYTVVHDQNMSIPDAMAILPLLPEPHKKAGRRQGPSIASDAPLVAELHSRVAAGEKRGVVAAELAGQVGGDVDHVKKRLLDRYIWERRQMKTARKD